MASAGAKKPNLVCPFTGKPIEICAAGGGAGWFGTVKGEELGYSTRLYNTKAELLYALSIRRGVLPEFPKLGEPIVVRDDEPPAADPLADIKEKGKVLDAQARESVDRLVSGR